MRTQIQSKFRLVFSRCGSRGLATGMACATVLRTPTGHPSRPPSVSQRSQIAGAKSRGGIAASPLR